MFELLGVGCSGAVIVIEALILNWFIGLFE
jgi:hypothetical protein